MLFQGLFLLTVALLTLGAVARWQHTPPYDPERAERGDMARLLTVTLAGAILLLVRSRVPLNTPGFYALSAALLPVVAVVLWLVRRLFGAYRAR